MFEFVLFLIIAALCAPTFIDIAKDKKKKNVYDPSDWRIKNVKDYTEEDRKKYKAWQEEKNAPAHRCYSSPPRKGYLCPRCGKKLRSKRGQWGPYDKCGSCGYTHWIE